jgi:hypothetical protein
VQVLQTLCRDIRLIEIDLAEQAAIDLRPGREDRCCDRVRSARHVRGLVDHVQAVRDRKQRHQRDTDAHRRWQAGPVRAGDQAGPADPEQR